MKNRSQAHWFQSRWRWRGIADDGPAGWRYADTLADCRTDFFDSEFFVAEIQRRVRGDEYQDHGTLTWGEQGPREVRA